MFLLPAGADSNRPALFDSHDGRRWSRAELAADVGRISTSLRSHRKLLIFLFCRNDAATVVSLLSSVEAGHAVALLDEGTAVEHRDKLVALYEPDLILSSSRLYTDGLPGYAEIAAEEPLLYLWRRTSAHDLEIHPELAVMLSTSGSTGTPKFVRLSKRNVESNAGSIRDALGITPEDRPITSLPIHYSYGLSVLNSHLIAGAEVVLSNHGLTSPQFWSTFRDNRCTSWAGVPYSYQILRRLDLDKLNVPTLQVITQAGGKLSTDLIAHFHTKIQARGGRMFVMYGQTEATARISVLPYDRLGDKLGSAGRALPGGRLAIETDDGITTGANVTGEVVYEGPNVMMGYATSRADLAAGDVQNGRLMTGDIGHLDEEGFLYVTGRRKRDAKVFGLRLNMDEIEDMMRVHGPTAVVSCGEKLLLFCEYGDADQFQGYARELSAKLKVHAGAFQFHRIEQLPLTANGKLDYARLEGRQ